MAINKIDHSAALTSKVVGVFEEMIPVRSGFAQWFPEETTSTLYVDVEVQRDNDLIAVDVVRFTEGNKNKYSKSTENKYQPPYFKEDYDLQRDEVYMTTIARGVGMESSQINKEITRNAVKGVAKNKAKIVRAIRKQQADVLQTGIIELTNGDNIDYRRKAESIVDVAAGPGVYWSDSANSVPFTDIRKGLDFLRNVGQSGGSATNVIMRSAAFEAFLASEQLTNQGAFVVQQIQRVNVTMPQFDGVSGFAHQGMIAAGDFSVHLWTYNEKYTNADGATQYYLDENLVVMIPDDFQGKTIFGGLPTLVESNGFDVPQIVEADFLIRNYSDKKTISSTIEISSAPLVVPFTIDKIYTMKVL